MHFSRLLTRFAASAALSAGLILAGEASAQAGEIHDRIDHQQSRIDAGVRDGQVSRGEAIRADRHLSRVEYERDRDLREHHGHLTPRERRHIDRELDRNSHEIHHDRRDHDRHDRDDWNRR